MRKQVNKQGGFLWEEGTVQTGCLMEALEFEGVLRGGTKGPELRKELEGCAEGPFWVTVSLSEYGILLRFVFLTILQGTS